MTKLEIKQILDNHLMWLEDNSLGKRANLEDANLQSVNLEGAYLLGANLQGADLRDANLRWADLRDTNLQDANFENTNLRDVIGNNREIKSMQLEKYNIVLHKNILCIGCEQKTIPQWKKIWDDKKWFVDNHSSEVWTWWENNRDLIEKFIN